MIGDADVSRKAARAELRAAGVPEGAGRVAVDLGAGTGPHALALAGAGYAVTAIDTCAPLLEELRAQRGGARIRCIHDDLLHLRGHVEGPVDVILCMGDTLTHLPSPQAVEQLFDATAHALSPGGMFVATFRDYTARALEGDARFIPVRQDDRRLLTCCLEYHDASVTVHDLLHERTDDGWTLRVSSYAKLRLDPEWARSAFGRLGVAATLDTGTRGMVRLVATRPA